MSKKTVIALGGNALGNNLPQQMAAVKKTSAAIADLIEAHHEVVIVHGNGPQVGMIQNAMTLLTRTDPEKFVHCPLSVCVAMSQGYIGYDLQNALKEELLNRGIKKDCATVLTQVEVDPKDPAFDNPTKPIGAFMTREEAEALIKDRDYNVIEDAGRGWRRVVASPKPKAIVELDGYKKPLCEKQLFLAIIKVLCDKCGWCGKWQTCCDRINELPIIKESDLEVKCDYNNLKAPIALKFASLQYKEWEDYEPRDSERDVFRKNKNVAKLFEEELERQIQLLS